MKRSDSNSGVGEAGTFSERVYAWCRRIPRGKVCTYGELARAVGTRSPRAVGQALRRNPHAPEVPCHRVVGANGLPGGFFGSASGGRIDEKIAILREEGVRFEAVPGGLRVAAECLHFFDELVGLEEFGGDGVGEEASFPGEGEVGLADVGQILLEE